MSDTFQYRCRLCHKLAETDWAGAKVCNKHFADLKLEAQKYYRGKIDRLGRELFLKIEKETYFYKEVNE